MTQLSLVRPIRIFPIASSTVSRPDNPAFPNETPACLEQKPVAHPTQFGEREGSDSVILPPCPAKTTVPGRGRYENSQSVCNRFDVRNTVGA